MALVGRVKAQGRLGIPTHYPEHDVAYLDLEVLQVVKGEHVPTSVRVWDPSFSTSCGLDLTSLVPGAYVAVAVTPNSADRDEYWDVMKFRPAIEDLLLGGCGDYLKRLSSAKAAVTFAAKVRNHLAR